MNMCADLFSLEDLALNLTLLQSTGNVVDGKITLAFVLRFDFMIESKEKI